MQGFHEERELEPVYDSRLVGWMLSYARPHWPSLSGCVLLLLVFSMLGLAQPYWLKLAIDTVMVPGARAAGADKSVFMAKLWPLAALYAGSVILGAALDYGQRLWLQWTGQSIIARIRKDVFSHLQKLDLAFFDANPVGRLVTRATNDVEALNQMYTSILVNLFQDLFSIVGAMGVMLSLDWRLALVSFAVIPAITAASWGFQYLSRKAWRDVRVKLARVNATLSENFSGMRLVQIFAREAKQASEFREINHAYYKASSYQLNVYAVFRPALELLTGFGLAALIWYGGAQTLAGVLGFGTLYAFTRYSQRLFEPINNLAEKYNVLQSALASAERLCQLLATVPAIADPVMATDPVAAIADSGVSEPPAGAIADANGAVFPSMATAPAPTPSDELTQIEFRTLSTSGSRDLQEAFTPSSASVPPAIEFQEVSFAYQDEDWVLRDLSFTVPSGRSAAFVGHTGAGKSTILSLVTRFYDVKKGRVLVDGIDVRDWPQAELRRRVGIVMQDVFLFSGDVLENLTLGAPHLSQERAVEAARAVGADGFIRALPAGYAEPVVERGLTLSAGQRQLISFARALAHDPAILMLDEATASIDSESEAALQQALKVVRRDRTMLVVAHRLSTIQDADCIFVLHKGRIREQGRHGELLAQGGLYQRLWRLQFDGAAITAF